MTLLGMVEEKVYCRYEGENSQKHLEESRPNGAMLGGQREKKRRWGEEEKREKVKRTKRGTTNQETAQPK